MKAMRRFLILIMAVAFLGAATAVTAGKFPTVTFTHDPINSIYTYHVEVNWEEGLTEPFGQLAIFSHAISWDGEKDLWTFTGAWVGGVDQGWAAGSSEGDYGDTIEWRASGEQEVLTTWAGDFVITAPDTVPVAGQGMSKDGVVGSVNYFNIDVPGLVAPEPSSFLALGGFLALAAPLIRRRIR